MEIMPIILQPSSFYFSVHSQTQRTTVAALAAGSNETNSTSTTTNKTTTKQLSSGHGHHFCFQLYFNICYNPSELLFLCYFSATNYKPFLSKVEKKDTWEKMELQSKFGDGPSDQATYQRWYVDGQKLQTHVIT